MDVGFPGLRLVQRVLLESTRPRVRHPHKRGYTFYHGGVHGAASRLDRFHISHLLMPFTEAFFFFLVGVVTRSSARA